MVPAAARAWAVSYKSLLDEGGQQSPLELPVVDHPNTDDARLASCLEVLEDRARSDRKGGEAFRAALSRTWLTTVSSGYCSTDARPVEGETAILVDQGLIRAVAAASALIGQHYAGPEFSLDACKEDQRESFSRAHTTFLGQYFLFGRASRGLGVASRDSRVDRRVAREALTFVLAHELGHVIAGHSPAGDRLSWLTHEQTPADLHVFAAEIEADAVGAGLLLGDMWGETVGQSEVDARLLALRAVLLTFETVEACALVPANRRHLPARRRWEGLLNALSRRFGAATLARHAMLWDAMSPHLRFEGVTDLEPPAVPISVALDSAGWREDGESISGSRADDGRSSWAVWDDLEPAVWQYRLSQETVELLVGFEAGSLLDPEHELGRESLRLGRAAVVQLVESLPAWLRGSDGQHGSASSGDLIAYLRHRDAWPEPFRSARQGILPIHTMASAARLFLAEQRETEGLDG